MLKIIKGLVSSLMKYLKDERGELTPEELQEKIDRLEVENEELISNKTVLEQEVGEYRTKGLTENELTVKKVQDLETEREKIANENKVLQTQLGAATIRSEFPDLDPDLYSGGTMDEMRAKAIKLVAFKTKILEGSDGEQTRTLQQNFAKVPGAADEFKGTPGKKTENIKKINEAVEKGDAAGAFDAIMESIGANSKETKK